MIYDHLAVAVLLSATVATTGRRGHAPSGPPLHQIQPLRDDPALPFAAFIDQAFRGIDERTLRFVVIDLRDNPGGNSAVTQPLINALRQRPGLRGRVYAIIGRGTISSAVINAIQLRDEAGAILAGEPSGGKPWSYGEQRSFTLPRSGVNVFHSTRFFRLGQVDTPSLEPLIAASIVSEDFFRNRDPFLDALFLAQRGRPQRGAVRDAAPLPR